MGLNGKTKLGLIAGLMIVAIAVIYAVPALGYMNGTSDQTRDRDQDRLRDQTCINDCLHAQDQTRTQLRLQDGTQTQTCAGCIDCRQNQWQYRFRYQNMQWP